MRNISGKGQAGAVRVRLALAGALVVSAMAAVPHAGFSGTRASHPLALASSAKPDWRGDYGNTGFLSTVTGPTLQPSLVTTIAPTGANVLSGVEFDGNGNLVFNDTAGKVFDYTTGGTQNSVATGLGPTGSNTGAKDGASAQTSASTDGNGYLYQTDDTGHLWQINPATGAAADIFDTTADGEQDSAGIETTPKIGPDGTIYVGTTGGDVYALTPSATFGAPATIKWDLSVAGGLNATATGSTAKHSKAPSTGFTQGTAPVFTGEAAVDAADGLLFITSNDTNSANPSVPYGSLYALHLADGTTAWSITVHNGASSTGSDAYPLDGANAGAVIYDGNEVIVANKHPQVLAVNPTTGALIWSDESAQLSGDVNPFVASPATNGTGIHSTAIYAVDTNNALFGLNESTGAILSGWPVTVANGSISSPVVDSAGNVFIEGNAANIYAFSPAGTQLWTLAGTGGAPRYMSPAIDSNGLVWVGGNSGKILGYQYVNVAATQTAIAQETANASANNTATAVAAATQTAAAAGTQTAVAAAQQTSTAAAIATQTANAAANNTATAVAAATQTAAAAATQTAAAAATQTAAAQQTAAAAATQTAAAASTSTAIAAATNTAAAAAAETSTAIAAATNTQVAANATSTAYAAETETQAPLATETAVAQLTALAGGVAENCQNIILPNPKVIQQGGSETILFKVLQSAVITATIHDNFTAPLTATLLIGGSPESTITSSTPVGGAVTFVFGPVGANGRALIHYLVPTTATLGTYTVTDTVTGEQCHVFSSPHNTTNPTSSNPTLHTSSSYVVEAPSFSTFNNGIQKGALKDGLIRSVEPAITPTTLPVAVYALPNAYPTLVNTDSAVYDHLHIVTAPGNTVEVQEYVVNKPITTATPTNAQNQITGYPGGPGALLVKFYDATTNAVSTSTTAYANFLVPVWSNLVIPGRGITVERQVYINGHLLIKSDYKVRETRLRLVIQTNEGTRGDKRAVITLGKPHGTNNHTTVTVTVLADKGATITGSLVLNGNTYTPTNTPPIVTGNGGRVHLKFSVLDGSTPTPPHTSATAQLSVTSTFRGATVTRAANVLYQQL
jgi:hypothetical protein